MTKREAMELSHQYDRLRALGLSYDDADQLHRISMTLRRWFEHECNGDIQRDETTGQCYYHYDRGSNGPFLTSKVADRETGARKRLAAIMAKHPTLTAYVQGDPRGCSLYILTADQLSTEHSIDAIYTRGLAVA